LYTSTTKTRKQPLEVSRSVSNSQGRKPAGRHMDDTISPNLKKYLNDLSAGHYEFTRREAAEKLGELSESNEEIVQALIAVESLDSEMSVRNAATRAMQSPVHQSIINQNPEMAQHAVEKWQRAKTLLEQEKANGYIFEFENRRKHERNRNFLSLGSMVIFLGLIAWLETMKMAWLGLFVFFGFFCLQAWQSWLNWRCPACDSSLSNRKASINPLFCSEPLRCPHCGIRLL
jgi:hypothetical protein